MKTVAIIQARMSSTRLPKKVLKTLGNLTVLEWVHRAAQNISGVDKVVVATSNDASDVELLNFCKSKGIDCFAGDLNDVLKRFYMAAQEFGASTVLRLTADCPLLDPKLCSEILYLHNKEKNDYTSNALTASWPDGLDCEILSFAALEKAHQQATKKSHREHVTQYIVHNRAKFKVQSYNSNLPLLHTERWTLDNEADYTFLREITQLLEPNKIPNYIEVLSVLDKNPKLRSLNQKSERNEGLTKSKNDELFANVDSVSYQESVKMLERAEKSIPLGSQTFSKSRTHYPVGHAPLFVTHGLGSRIWDVDGNEYVDLVNALLPNVLGYADPDVDYAIKKQLSQGISLSLATELEIQLAEELIKIIPCAESVRFGKNGSDATTGCIRVARAFTGRERVMVSGYHGWQDWYIGSTTRNKGVPHPVQALTSVVPYNNLNAVEDNLKKHPSEYACMILEPMNFVEPEKDYLKNLKELLHKHGTLLVFDEVITGFRYSLGGAQEYFGVTPDLASFGKSMGNGMPIATVVGRKDIMKEMEEIFFSTTFGGETLSLAASLATIKKMKEEKVIEALWAKGAQLAQGVNSLLEKHSLTNVIKVVGKDPWRLLQFSPYKNETVEVIKTFFSSQIFNHGVLSSGTHNICYALQEADISHVLSAYGKVFSKLEEELKKENMQTRLKVPVLKPLFKVR